MAKNSQNKEISNQWLFLILLIAIICAGVSIELANIYIRVRLDPEYESFCAVSDLANCDTVAVSRYSSFLEIPVAIWGLSAYAGITAFCVWGLIKQLRPAPVWPLPFLFTASLFSLGVSLLLLSISAFIIKSFCPLCMTIYGLNLLILLIALFGMRQGGIRSMEDIISHAFECLRKPRITISGSFLIALLMASVIAGYTIAYGQVPVELPKGPGGLIVGVDDEGNHWIGAQNPILVIQEFSDYQCPFCRRAHQIIRRWVTKHADKVRLVHRHLPLDHHCNPLVTRPYHPNACEMTKLAYCAGVQGKFWEMNDLLYSLPLGARLPSLDIIANELNLDSRKLKDCVDSDYCEECLRRDINFCVERNMKATPTFYMNEKMYVGMIPKQEVEQALANAIAESESQKGIQGVHIK
jgi:protein-disulfide isomerase/uncharacterized membrane protein